MVSKICRRWLSTVVGGAAAASPVSTSASSSHRAPKRLFSGIQPSGRVHLGNYLGAIQQWVSLQNQGSYAPSDLMLSIVDLHALTSSSDGNEMRHAVREVAATLLACGLEHERCVLFQQSHVKQHTELSWILSCITPMNWLQAMTQYREKVQAGGAANVGLFAYPVLMAADILLYKATVVPVGEDQTQHIRLARDIVEAVNRRAKYPVFPMPEAVLSPCKRIMSLKDGSKKMSKSNGTDSCRIHMTDTADEIRAKIRTAKSDSIMGLTFEPETRPEVANLLTIYAALSRQSVQDVQSKYHDKSTSEFKRDLTDVVIEHVCPIGDRIRELMDRSNTQVDEVLASGAKRAEHEAEQTMREVRRLVGFS